MADDQTAAIVDTLSELGLFTDLGQPELERIAQTFEEEWIAEHQRVLRQGFAGAGFYVILDGDVAVRIDGQERARLSRGDFFGELSVLLGDAPVADIVALSRCACSTCRGRRSSPS